MIETVASGLFIHIVGNFANGLDINQYEGQTDHALAVRYEKELHDWIVVRSGADMISK